MKKKRLAMILSTLGRVESSDLTLEQYPTGSELAADMAYTAASFGDIEGKRVADLGCGNGILGFACSILGAAEVLLVDKDGKAVEKARQNENRIEKDLKGRLLFFNCDIEDICLTCDAVIMNPPFGSRRRHGDRQFLLKAFRSAPIVYSLHKRGNLAYLGSLNEEFGITNVWKKKIRIERMFEFHKKKNIDIEVDFVRFIKVM